jgi:nucleoside-diphosphate-sugar epimerase
MTQISILGCGWLGLPLAKALLEKGFSVKGSTTSIEKLSILEKSGIHPHLIVLSEGKPTGNLNDFLESSEILLIDVPPKLRGNSKENFVEKIKNLIPFIEKSTVENVIFISSTSVYGDTSSFDCAQDDTLSVTEETKTCPDTESGKQLVQAEQLLQTNPNFKTTILRFGGLIGEDRHPIKFLAGRKNIENPNAPINLIHQDDCLGIIEKIIEKSLRQAQTDKLDWNETFNAVTPFHPSRKDYYTQKALELNLNLPEFNPENDTFGKTILSEKIETVLGYTFKKTKL